ncbi:MAG: hypothetical protein ACPGO3_05895 [Magnetospiraceae bacterium]
MKKLVAIVAVLGMCASFAAAALAAEGSTPVPPQGAAPDQSKPHSTGGWECDRYKTTS